MVGILSKTNNGPTGLLTGNSPIQINILMNVPFTNAFGYILICTSLKKSLSHQLLYIERFKECMKMCKIQYKM